MILNPGKVIAGRYEIVEKIGSGGMANVYRARDKKLDRYVTFKVMREDFVNDEEFIARFNVEAQAAACLSNQNIVNVYDVGQEGLIYYIVMEYIDGVTLKDLIKKRASFENDEILGVAIQIASGLVHAHEKGIVHRDIKPQNIMVTVNGVIKVMDFGIARAVTAGTMATTGNAMGSVHYFSPEQARGGYVDYKSDIYSLGIVMFEMSTGILPFDGDTPVAIAIKQINDKIPNIKDIRPKVSQSIVKIIEKCTEKLSAKRYQSTQQLVNDLKRALTNTTGDFVKNKGGKHEENPTVILDKSLIEEINKDVNSIKGQNLEDSDEYEETYDDYDEFEGEYGLDEEDEFEYEEDNNKYNEKYNKDDYDVNAERKAERRIIFAAMLTSVAIIVLILLIGTYILRQFVPKVPDPITVPNLVGKTVEEATAETKEMEVLINATGEVYSDNIPKGKIATQSIGNDDLLYKGESIDVAVSKGTDKFDVPNTIGMQKSEAYETIRKEGHFLATDEFRPDETIPINTVISQEPQGNSIAKAGITIKLILSSGPEVKTVVVPDVVGKSEAQVKEMLESNDLAVSIKKEFDENVPKGEVVGQSLKAGEEVAKNSTVVVIISRGKDPKTSPKPTVSPSQTPIGNSKPIIIDVPPGVIPEGTDVVNVTILKKTASGTEEYYNKNVPSDSFPFVVDIEGEGKVEISVFIKDPNTNANYYFGSENIEF